MSELTTTPEQQKEAARIAQWQNFAIEYRDTLQNLQLNCSAIETRLAVLPSDVKQIPAYETVLADAKRELVELDENKRKPLTAKINALIERQMGPGKAAQLKVTTYANALLTLKKEAEEAAKKVKAKKDEADNIRKYFADHIASIHGQIEQAIVAAVTKVFEFALAPKSATDTAPNIDEVGLEKYLEQVKASKKYAESVWVTLKPTRISPPVHHSVAEVDAIWEAVAAEKITPPATYRASFLDQLGTRFDFYNISLTNREASLKLALQEQAESVAAIQADTTNATIANKLETVSAPAVVTGGGKKLKKVYKLEIENNPANLRLLLTALVANADALLPLIKTKTFFETIQNVLVAYKNKDEKFECGGVVFTEDVKL